MTTTVKFNQAPNQNESADIEEVILSAIDEARTTCEQGGSDSASCAVAWDIVEELQAEKSHQEQAKKLKVKTSLETYCDSNPDALECLIYDV